MYILYFYILIPEIKKIRIQSKENILVDFPHTYLETHKQANLTTLYFATSPSDKLEN